MFLSFYVFQSLLCSFGGQKAKWKAKIEREDGVFVVKSPKKLMYGEDIFSLEEELSIGKAGGRDEYIVEFNNVVGLNEYK